MKAFRFLPAILLASQSLLAAPSNVGSQTIIDSVSLQMKGMEDRNYFTFTDDVRVKNQNLTMTCDSLEVISLRGGDENATVGQIGAIESIIAVGNVVIQQADRVAYAGKAEVDPNTGSVILSENPRIVDSQAVVSGWKIILNKGDKIAKVLPSPAGSLISTRSTVTLSGDALPDMTYDNTPPPAPKEEPAPVQETPLPTE